MVINISWVFFKDLKIKNQGKKIEIVEKVGKEEKKKQETMMPMLKVELMQTIKKVMRVIMKKLAVIRRKKVLKKRKLIND